MRVTKDDLQDRINFLNRLTHHAEEPWTKADDGSYCSNDGTYALSGAYGGWKLVQIVGTGGAERNTLQCGYVRKSELYALLNAYIDGIQATSK